MKEPNQSDQPVLALFDFDGTLTTRDSFLAFLLFTHGRKKLVAHAFYLWPVLALFKLRLFSNSFTKHLVFKRLFQNWPLTYLQEKAAIFCRDLVPAILNPEAIDKFQWHKLQGHRIVVVTAMFGPLLEPWCRSHNIELLATEPEVKNGLLTGNFSTANCYGEEKARRIKAARLLDGKPLVYAYGDTAGDKAMLALACKPFYRCFH